MKSYFFRLSRNCLFWALIVIQVVVIICYAIYYAANVYHSDERWEHNIVKYENADDLENQKNSIWGQIENLNEETDKSRYNEEEKQFLKESVDIIDFLKKNNYSYDEVTEATMIYHMENDRRAYFSQNIELLLWLNMFVSILLIGLIVNYTKTNGSRTFDIILHGRSTIFFRDLRVYMTLMGLYISMQFIIVAVISSQFSSRSQFFLYYNNGDIKVLSLTNILLWTMVSFVLYFGEICILHFCLSQIINDVFYFTIITAVITVGLKFIMINLSHNKFILAINITMDNIYENKITIGIYLFALLLKYVAAGGLFAFTYAINKKRKIKIIVN